MKAKNLLLIAIAALSLAGCKYDDDAIWDAVNKQEERISALETWQKQASQEIAALKAITDESDYILSIDSIMDGTIRTGYTITFKKSGTITLMNGQKGDKGDTPLISLQQGKDGNWYWTLNGDLMTDANGAPIRANGAAGTPAPTPQLKTGSQLKAASVPGTWQTDAFYLSVDNGKTWNKVSGDKGEKGDTGATGAPGSSGSGSGIIAELEGDNTYVKFSLPSGKSFFVPIYDAIALKLVITDVNDLVLKDGEGRAINFSSTATFTYSLSAVGSTIVVIPPTGWTATLNRKEQSITIGSPSQVDCQSNSQLAGPVETVVVVSNGNGLSAMYAIRTIAASDLVYCDADNLIEMLEKHSNVKNLKVSGTLTAEHMAKIKELKSSLVEIDMEEATLDGGIPDEQFRFFENLTTVKLPKDLKKIGGDAFFSCEKLTTVSNIEGVEEIGGGAFQSCKVLNSAMELKGLTKIGIGAFSDCEKLPSITIGDQVTELPYGVFTSCTSLKVFTVPASVKTIGSIAFNGCNGLNTITIKERVETIGADAFRDCSSLTEITLPSTLKEIGTTIFYGCNSLESLTCKSVVPPTCNYVGQGSLGNNLNNNLKIYVPSGSVDDYKKHDFWSQYSEKIEAIQE